MAEGLNILVVDDHCDTVQALRRYLTRKGHHVRTAGSVQDAIDVIGTEKFDLLLSDIGMPGHDGFELLASVRGKYAVGVFAVTGYGMPEDVQRITEAGFDDFLVKPINLGRLDQAIDAFCIARGRGSRSATATPANTP